MVNCYFWHCLWLVIFYKQAFRGGIVAPGGCRGNLTPLLPPLPSLTSWEDWHRGFASKLLMLRNTPKIELTVQ